MAIEAERLLAIFEAKFDALDKALAKSRAAANENFAGIEAAGTRAENTLARVGSRGTPSFDKMSKSIQNTSFQTGNLAAQLNDIGVQLAGGQSPFLIAIQQGTQIQQALGSAGAKGAITAVGGAFASLVNPVGLATIAIIALGGTAIQYFASLATGGEKSEETLKREADLIQKVASQWGAALPALKAYADEQARLADQQDKLNALIAARENSGEPLVQGFADATAEIADLQDKLNTLGQNAAAQDLRDKFEELKKQVENGTVTQQDFNDVMDAARSTFADAKLNGDGFIAMLESLAGRAAALIPTMASLAGEVDKVFGGSGSPNGRSPTGKTLGYDPRFSLPDSAPTPDSAPNREDVLAAQEKAAAAAARRASRGQRATADDRINEDIQSIRDRTAALQQEASMLGLSFEEQQRRKIALDLEQQALKQLREEAVRKGQTDLDSIHLSPEQVASINAVADAYAQQAEALKEAREAQALQRDILQGAFGDLRSALDDGKLDWQDLGNIALNALDKIIDKIENDLIDAILQANSAAGGGGGIFGSLLGALGLGGGSDPGIISALGLRAAGGPVQAGKPYIVGEKRPELFVPNQSGTILPSVPSVQNAGSSASGATISPVFAPQISMNGNGDTEAVLSQMRKFLDKEFLPRTLKALRQAKIRGMDLG
ncbi:phage tail length tape measure family protein [Mesorhizobium sp. BH1-1-5]|uniref:phage tail length tape measure family protein n=1 Tax=Mesorhizobium sp. BH1-1-5 TaxID=2876661 RepID=UPI001CCCB9BC|nr:phage tail length tape measure family protein [Mesorhizobium sp. BH1-1-5]MBZ9985664.1 phage tail length tape measure family protein [Mesorhizobium sp. BH1-1-5]